MSQAIEILEAALQRAIAGRPLEVFRIWPKLFGELASHAISGIFLPARVCT